MTAAIIVAAGSSRRMGFDKLMAPLDGLTVLDHSIKAFDECPEVTVIAVVTDSDRILQLNLSKLTTDLISVDGGNERQHSVCNGLAALPREITTVAIHDGARPLVKPQAISQTILAAQEHQAAALARPITETLKRADENEFVTESISREGVWAMETPQAFDRSLLENCYGRVQADNLHVTDEVSVLQHCGQSVKLVPSLYPNPKMTFPKDLEYAELLLERMP